jgi:outer membrane protein OmpA-like peptidoglycan-associated protein
MNATVASGILLALGTVDLGVLNLILAPRLSRASTAVVVNEVPVAPDPPAREARALASGPGTLIAAASIETATPPARAIPDVEFAFDSTSIDRLAAVHDLRRLAQELGADPGRQILLRGHSDPLGAPLHNLELSRRRAAAIKDYLVIRGAAPSSIAVVAIGPSELADPLQTPAAWARDRRVEILWR